MLPLKYRDYELFQGPYFFKRFKDRKASLGYQNHRDFLMDFYIYFRETSKSVILHDPRPNDGERYCETICLFKKETGEYICVTLKESEGYYEMVNVMPAQKWLRDIFDNKDQIRKEALTKAI